jgi:hypothetical protein
LYGKLLLLEELITATPALGLTTLIEEEEEEEGFMSGKDRSQTNQLFSEASLRLLLL